jgi:L-fuconolactonase
MATIDAHQHFWLFNPVRDAWIGDDMRIIQRNFLPADLLPVLKANGIDGTIAVQADQSETENEFLLQLAEENEFIKGVVGWVDFCAPDIEERLAFYKGNPKMKGFRHVLQGEKDRAHMLLPGFKNGISKLEKFGFSYDILIYPDQLAYAWALCAAYPNQSFIVDHLAKPKIKAGELTGWKKEIEKFASLPNVYCKVSGIITEADWANWTINDINPYLDVVVASFGVQKLLFGSDWPVCLVAGNYARMKNLVEQYFVSFSADEKRLIFGANAEQFYQLQ